MEIRDIRTDDIPAVTDIYSHYVEHTAISFEYTAPKEEEMARRVEAFKPYPYLVAEEDGKILGYAYAHRFGEREAYKRSVEVSIYVNRDEVGKGVGKHLYEELENRLRTMDIHNLYAVVVYPGEGSVEFHQKMGYRICGKLTDCGEKFGILHSVVYMEKHI